MKLYKSLFLSLFLASSANAALITLDTVDQGWINSTGFHITTNDNTYTGLFSGNEYRSFYTFDASSLFGASISSVSVSFASNGQFVSDNGTESVTFYDSADLSINSSSIGSISNFNDLGSGSVYGSYTLSGSNYSSMPSFSTTLNSNAFGGLEDGGLFTFGAALNTITSNNTEAYWSGSIVVPAATLTIEYDTNPVPEPSILALMGLGLAGLGFARRRKLVS